MKQREKCSGRGGSTRQVHHKHFGTECLCRACQSFDRAKSNRVDSTSATMLKEENNVNANDEQFALAA